MTTTQPQLTSDQMTAILYRFAPRVYLHDAEIYRPASVPWLLQSASLYYAGQANPVLAAPIQPGALITQQQGSDRSGYVYTDPTPATRSQFYLAIPDGAKGGEQYQNSLCVSECYAAVVRQGDHWYDLVYAFCYTYNGLNNIFDFDIGSHWGDWEHVTVRVSADGETLVGIYLARHGKYGEWDFPSQFQMQTVTSGVAQGTQHPVIYAALQTHASYGTAGAQPYLDPIPSLVVYDQTAAGHAWDTWNNLKIVGTPWDVTNVPPDQQWLLFTGSWGQADSGNAGGGPSSPCFQSWWANGESDTGPIWFPNLSKQGVYGGRGGTVFDDSALVTAPTAVLQKVSMYIRKGPQYKGQAHLCGIELTYANTSATILHGSRADEDQNIFTLTLEPDETIVAVTGHTGSYISNLVPKRHTDCIFELTLHTSTGRLVQAVGVGTEGRFESAFEMTAGEGQEIVGFFGATGDALDAIGVILRGQVS